MPSIPQRALRNDSAEILRRVEAGERFTVTVAGRPVADIGPVRGARFVSGPRVREALGVLPPDDTLLDDLRTSGGGAIDPFA